jgi:hypothetical protein
MIRNIAPVKPWIIRRPSGVWVGTRNTGGDVGNELLLQQQTEKERTIPDMETEIECPRCYDIMALSSDFDRRLARIHLDYTYGLDKIYAAQEIEKANASPSFEREYNNKYGYGIGSVLLPDHEALGKKSI